MVGGVGQSLTRQPLPMLRQWTRLLQALQRQLQSPVRFVSVIRILTSSPLAPTPRGLT